MKLYIYDHCPFCSRARMIFGLRQMAVEEIVLLNDDETTPIALIGAKQVPILQKADGSHMGESLDIVNYINALSGNPPLADTRAAVQTWLQRVGEYINRLIMPRDVELGLPEFATPESIQYFIDKKEKFIGSFAENRHKTPEYLAKINADLRDLDALIQSPDWANGATLSLDDIVLFPILRNLSMVKGIVFPEKTLHYVQNMAQKAKMDLYFDRAL
ncbi:glutaredoxin 2 [Alysiella filiformis]|uniref:Glutaredoxin 2 n=1 Tax=Alysiella filiformis DSM 16848 TaxID=1120981 RepID=A0A286EA15_9NEIS|nr:glutaredoxin 2 [Alysiella filiformis]QMT31358.1 glutaredoxin 2 [Alysiella filiformis]UBQ55634.1 glutaredoxin 2 [Alysiella filiformis DSM 16848]SOD67726.1 glutaredoxin 2 [Alysiella filiformis DSM 16848]